jgi:hypothetical protein
MRALVLSAAKLNLQTLIGTFGSVGIEDAWVISNNAGDKVSPDPAPDLVIGVLDPSEAERPAGAPFGPGTSQFANIDVGIRVGVAIAQGLPTLLVAPPPLPKPADTLGVVVASSPLDDFDTLRLHLWAFVSTMPSRAALEASRAIAEPVAFDATPILNELYAINGDDSSASLQVERLIAAVLSRVGAEFVENPEPDGPDGRVDLAVLPSRTSNEILLIEVKAGRLSEQRLSEAERQLQAYVIERHASLGLVLYHDFADNHWPSPRTIPLVIRMSARELIAGLITNSLPQLINGVARDAARRL